MTWWCCDKRFRSDRAFDDTHFCLRHEKDRHPLSHVLSQEGGDFEEKKIAAIIEVLERPSVNPFLLKNSLREPPGLVGDILRSAKENYFLRNLEGFTKEFKLRIQMLFLCIGRFVRFPLDLRRLLVKHVLLQNDYTIARFRDA